MEDVEIPPNKALDPWGKNVVGFNVGRDSERTPMQWNTSIHAGFTNGKPWLSVSPNYKEKNVKTESKDPGSILSFYKELIHYRANSPALLTGSYIPLESGNENIFVFGRECNSEKLLIAINFSDEEQTATLPMKGLIRYSTCDDRNVKKELSTTRLTLKSYQGLIIEQK